MVNIMMMILIIISSTMIMMIAFKCNKLQVMMIAVKCNPIDSDDHNVLSYKQLQWLSGTALELLVKTSSMPYFV